MFRLGFLLGFGPFSFLIRMAVRFCVHLVAPLVFVWIHTIQDGSIPQSWIWGLFGFIIVAAFLVELLWTFVTMYNFERSLKASGSWFYKFDLILKRTGQVLSGATIALFIMYPESVDALMGYIRSFN